MTPHRTHGRRALLLGLAGVAVAAGVPATTAAQSVELLRREVAAVGVTEKLGAPLPRDVSFTDDVGRAFTLEALRGKPALLSLNYTGCSRLCSLQLAGLSRALRDMGWVGDRFQIATLSIDPAEKPESVRRYKETYVHQATGGEAMGRAWHFLSGKKDDIDAVADAVGFRYRYDAKSGEFAHQATLVVLTRDGRVSSYLHGISYEPAAIRAALDRADRDVVASAAQQASLGGFLLTCMGFNPADPAPRALRIMRTTATAVVLSAFLFLGVYVVRQRRRSAS